MSDADREHPWLTLAAGHVMNRSRRLAVAPPVAEQPMLDEVDQLSTRSILVPWLTTEPSGVDGLNALIAA